MIRGREWIGIALFLLWLVMTIVNEFVRNSLLAIASALVAGAFLLVTIFWLDNQNRRRD